MVDQHEAPTPGAGGGVPDAGDGDRLLAVRAALDEVETLPLDERAAVFEQAHAVVVEELRALELG